MSSFTELLKSLENAASKGFNGEFWKPHKSPEGGTRTIAYGYKLSPQEDRGNYISLPDGTTVDLDERGLTPEEAEALFQANIQTARSVAQAQWNRLSKSDVEFEQLPAKYQDILTEISFNVGGLKNDKGKWGWPNLAKGMLAGDDEAVANELSRTYTKPDGTEAKLDSRTTKIKQFISENDYEVPQLYFPHLVSRDVQGQGNTPSRASESVSEGVYTEAEESIINSLIGVNKRSEAESEGVHIEALLNKDGE